ncbi:hypothetical protein [Clostridium sp.]|nr:hypothetical protein [Clostridium sp.]MDR3597371.1 hypothetical protein [Clostridium sp.]
MKDIYEEKFDLNKWNYEIDNLNLINKIAYLYKELKDVKELK